jgi:GTPase SAR1 family protein
MLTVCRSCLLHRFIRDEWKSLSSHTIGVEFANKIIKLGSGARRKRMKLQVSIPLFFSRFVRIEGLIGYSYGIQPDKNDFGQLQEVIIEVQQVPC